MTNQGREVKASWVATHEQSGREVPIRGYWSEWDAYALILVMRGDNGERAWTIARDLLLAGLHKRSGEGDVAVWPVGTDSVWLSLLPRETRHTFTVSMLREDVMLFLGRTLAIVPKGGETARYDLDAVVAMLLEGAA